MLAGLFVAGFAAFAPPLRTPSPLLPSDHLLRSVHLPVQGNRRLYKRWRHFTERRKNPLVANVAIARELAGWCWSLANDVTAALKYLADAGDREFDAVSEPTCREPMSHNSIERNRA